MAQQKRLFSAAQQPRPTVTTEGVFFFFTGILARWDQNSGIFLKFFLQPGVSFFFTGILARWGFLKKIPKFGLGWPHVIASREANDGVVPLTCFKMFV